MEQVNRCLKDNLLGLGANVMENIVVSSSKSLKGIVDVCSNFVEVCGVTPESIHHTTKVSLTDRDMVLAELTSKSCVFDYVPGRQDLLQHTPSDPKYCTIY